MSLVNMIDLEEVTKLKPVVIKWSEKYACPIYILDDGRMYVEDTGEYAGYFDEVAPPSIHPYKPTIIDSDEYDTLAANPEK